MRTQRAADIVSGLFIALVGVILAIEALNIPNPLDEPLHPNTLPLWMSIFTIFVGLLLSFRAYRSANTELTVDWPDKAGWWRNAVTFVCLAGYLLIIPSLGLPLASALFCVVMIYYLERTPVRSVVTGLCVALILYYGFVIFLELPFPLGILEHFN